MATSIGVEEASGVSGGTTDVGKWATFVAVAVSVFMLPLDYTVVAVALHDIQRDLGAGYADLQWIVNGYTLTFAAFLLAGGGLADRFGRRRIFLVGMAVFAASSLGCGLAADALLLNPTGRVGRVEEIAALVALVASPLGGFINGANVRIDGGYVVGV